MTLPSFGEGIKKGRWRTIFPRISMAANRWRPVSLAALSVLRRIRPRENRYVRAPLVAFAELHVAVRGREQGVVPAHADIVAGMKLGAALADDNVAGDNRFAAEFLHAQSLAR